ncbi:hypothetical protein Goari_003561 [Gossypium aridum]|uniref:Uncharacterized protein n=1 Tax=Gossypium aridum TaxID=34290 RepID=A0A7J8YCB4_GOSAI|nr:hypothetical protein [Gossypium aridum]
MNRALHWQPRFFSKNIEILKYIMVDKMFIENNELLRLANSQCLGIAFKRVKGVKPILMTLTKLHPLGSLYIELVDIVPISYPNLKPLLRCHCLSKLELKVKTKEGSSLSHHCLSKVELKVKIKEDSSLSHHILKFLPSSIVKLTL